MKSSLNSPALDPAPAFTRNPQYVQAKATNPLSGGSGRCTSPPSDPPQRLMQTLSSCRLWPAPAPPRTRDSCSRARLLTYIYTSHTGVLVHISVHISHRCFPHAHVTYTLTGTSAHTCLTRAHLLTYMSVHHTSAHTLTQSVNLHSF